MNRWEIQGFATRVAEQMCSWRSTTSYRVEGRQITIDIDGYVILTLTTTGEGLDAEFRLHEKVAQRNEPADPGLIDSARTFFDKAFNAVAKELLGLIEKMPTQV